MTTLTFTTKSIDLSSQPIAGKSERPHQGENGHSGKKHQNPHHTVSDVHEFTARELRLIICRHDSIAGGNQKGINTATLRVKIS